MLLLCVLKKIVCKSSIVLTFDFVPGYALGRNCLCIVQNFSLEGNGVALPKMCAKIVYALGRILSTVCNALEAICPTINNKINAAEM